MKKTIITFFLAVLLLGALYGMRVYTDSFNNSSNSKIEANEGNKINKEDNIKSEESKHSDEIDQASGDTEENEDEIKYNEQNNFTLIDLEGNEVSLSDYQGKKVFLNFWATWCPPCKGEMPDMEVLHNEIDESEVVILAINLGDEERLIKRFIEGEEFTFKVLQDRENAVAAQYMISSIPISYLIDENGEIVKKVVGAMNLEQMKELIKY